MSMPYSLLLALKPKGYNYPHSTAMLVSQWWHQGFLYGWWSYEEYVARQNFAYITQPTTQEAV